MTPDVLPGRGRVVLREDDFILRHHRVHGVPVLPGVAFLDLVCRMAAAGGREPADLELQEIVFPEPVAGVAGHDNEIEVVAGGAPGRVQVVGRSRRTAGGRPVGEWAENFRAVVVAGVRGPEPAGVPRAPSGPGSRTRPIEEMYAHTRSRDIRHGAPMMCVGDLRIGGGELLAELELARPDGTEHGFHLHPAKLDAASIVAYGQSAVAATEPFIPLFIERFRAPRPLPGRFTVHVPRPERLSPSGELFRSDLALYDAQGRFAAELVGLTCKRIREPRSIHTLLRGAAPS